MIHCRGCGQLIHETASTCPHCGAVQTPLAAAPVTGTLWLPVSSFISAVVAVLAFAGEEHPGRDLAAGIGLFAGVAIVLSGVALARQSRGRGLAIAAMVLGVIAALAALGSQL
jgi:drug/metabolite transporter (DMT)-like permease